MFVVVDCGTPPSMRNSRFVLFNPGITTVGTYATYYCLPGYVFQARNGVNIATGQAMPSKCLISGTWSPTTFVCVGRYRHLKMF